MRWIAVPVLAAIALAQQATSPPKPADPAKPDPELARQLEIRRLVQLEVRQQFQQIRAAGAASPGGDLNDIRLRSMETEISSLRREVQSLQQAIWNLQARQR